MHEEGAKLQRPWRNRQRKGCCRNTAAEAEREKEREKERKSEKKRSGRVGLIGLKRGDE